MGTRVSRTEYMRKWRIKNGARARELVKESKNRNPEIGGKNIKNGTIFITTLLHSDYDKYYHSHKLDGKDKTRCQVEYLVLKGKIKREPCSVRGEINKVEAHHEDYTQPLNITWLCRKHHVVKRKKDL